MTEDWYLSLYGDRCATTAFFRSLEYAPGLPELLKSEWIKNQRAKIKIAIVGCSTGEDAYSYSLICAGLDIDYEVHGYDVHHDRVYIASKGCYPIDQEVIDHAQSSFLEIVQLRSSAGLPWTALTFNRTILQRTLFFQHDISIDPLANKYDAVICTNALGQPQRGGREAAIQNVFHAVSEDGFCLTNYGDKTGIIPFGLSRKRSGKLMKITL